MNLLQVGTMASLNYELHKLSTYCWQYNVCLYNSTQSYY